MTLEREEKNSLSPKKKRSSGGQETSSILIRPKESLELKRGGGCADLRNLSLISG